MWCLISAKAPPFYHVQEGSWRFQSRKSALILMDTRCKHHHLPSGPRLIWFNALDQSFSEIQCISVEKKGVLINSASCRATVPRRQPRPPQRQSASQAPTKVMKAEAKSARRAESTGTFKRWAQIVDKTFTSPEVVWFHLENRMIGQEDSESAFFGKIFTEFSSG